MAKAKPKPKTKASPKAKAKAKAAPAATARSVVAAAKAQGAQMIDFKFVDFPGTWQHFSIPASALEEEMFSDGLGFDGSSIRGWQSIDESDMLVMPDPATAFRDPFCEVPTLSIICDIVDPITREDYGRDPRNVARRAEAFLKSTGLADTAYFGPEAEFFVFDSIQYDQNAHSSFHFIDSVEGRWNSGADEQPNLGYKPPYKGGYFPVPPHDTLQDIRSEMVLTMMEAGVDVEVHHHEVGTAGQGEIDIRFCPLVSCGDQMMIYKYVVKNVAKKHGKTATFMPKPLFEDNGTGMHTHQSLWKGGRPLFAGNGYAGLSEMALHYIGGLLKHARSILAFTNPTTNSYRRLVPGYEAPVNLAYSQRNRSAACRIPMYSASPKAKRVEFPLPRSQLQPVPGDVRHADGRSRRGAQQDRPGRPDGHRHLRAVRRGAGIGAADPGVARRGDGRPRGGSRLPAQGRRLHRGRHPGLDRLQAGRGDRRHTAATPPVRVRPLLRHGVGL